MRKKCRNPSILEKNGLKQKHRNTQKSILSGTGDLVTCMGEQSKNDR